MACLLVILVLLLIFVTTAEAGAPKLDELQQAAYLANVDAIRQLALRDPLVKMAGKMDIDVNRLEAEHGRSALMLCGYDPQVLTVQELDRDCTAIAKLLVEGMQANVSIVDKHGDDALSMAAVRGMTNFCVYLLDQGASSNRVNNKGQSALFKAAAHGHGETFSMLAKRGANISHVETETGRSALHMAVTLAMTTNDDDDGKHLLFLKLVLVSLLNVSSAAIDEPADALGRTPLHYAVISKNHNVAKMLLEYGADASIEDDYGIAAMHMTRDQETLTMLLESVVARAESQHARWLLEEEKQWLEFEADVPQDEL